MKNIINYIKEAVFTANKKADENITLEKFLKDIDKIVSKYTELLDDENKKPSSRFFATKKKWDAKYIVENADYYYNYCMKYSLSDNYYLTNSFCLIMYVWYDEKFKRPRYSFNEFSVKLPATRKGGYSTIGTYNFKSTKIVPEYYKTALEKIEDKFKRFADNTKIMQETADKCDKKHKQIQRSDFDKVAEKIYGDLFN